VTNFKEQLQKLFIKDECTCSAQVCTEFICGAKCNKGVDLRVESAGWPLNDYTKFVVNNEIV